LYICHRYNTGYGKKNIKITIISFLPWKSDSF
jgi:hypothetical protein